MQASLWTASIFSETLLSGGRAASMTLEFFSNSGLLKKGNEGTLFSTDVNETMQGCDIQPLFLGDPAYPLLPWLVTGYPENSNTSDDERHFNYMLSMLSKKKKTTC